jgi:hypothetical protein
MPPAEPPMPVLQQLAGAGAQGIAWGSLREQQGEAWQWAVQALPTRRRRCPPAAHPPAAAAPPPPVAFCSCRCSWHAGSRSCLAPSSNTCTASSRSWRTACTSRRRCPWATSASASCQSVGAACLGAPCCCVQLAGAASHCMPPSIAAEQPRRRACARALRRCPAFAPTRAAPA